MKKKQLSFWISKQSFFRIKEKGYKYGGMSGYIRYLVEKDLKLK